MKQKLVAVIARWALGGIFREVAEGKRGARLKAAYWWLAGKKRMTGAVIGLAYAAVFAFDQQLAARIAPTVAMVVGLFVGWGLVDAAWRDGRPLPEWQAPFAKIMSAGPALAAIVALAVEYLPQIPGCTWCDGFALRVQLVAAAVATGSGWLAARFSAPPTISD